MLTQELGTVLDQSLAGEILFLGLLGEMVFTYPDPHTKTRQWFEFLLKQDMFSDPPFGAGNPDVGQGMQLLNNWAAASQGHPIEDVMLELQADNTYLFACVGKVLAPPWESVYFNRKRLVNQEPMLEVRSWYRRYGLAVDKLFVESDDHIGLEMIFAAQLATQALKAKEAGDLEKFATLVGAQREFLATHLLLWGAVWCNQVLKYARTDFYRGLAYAIRGAMEELGRIFEIKVNFPKEEAQAG